MRLKELRLEKNLTQSDIAKAINTSQRNIGRWENGDNEPTSSFVIQLAKYLDVSADYLLGLEDDFGARMTNAPATMGESLTADERKILEQYRCIPEKLKVLVRQQLEIYTAPGELLPKPQKK